MAYDLMRDAYRGGAELAQLCWALGYEDGHHGATPRRSDELMGWFEVRSYRQGHRTKLRLVYGGGYLAGEMDRLDGTRADGFSG